MTESILVNKKSQLVVKKFQKSTTGFPDNDVISIWLPWFDSVRETAIFGPQGVAFSPNLI